MSSDQLTESYEQTLEAEVHLQDSVIANLTNALERASEERVEMARRSKEREEQFQTMIDELVSQINGRNAAGETPSPTNINTLSSSSGVVNQAPSSRYPKSLSPEAIGDDNEGDLSGDMAPESNGEDDDGSCDAQEDDMAGHTAAGSRRKTAAYVSDGQKPGPRRQPPKGGFSRSASPLQGAPTTGSSSPPHRSTSAKQHQPSQLKPLIRYQSVLSRSTSRHQDAPQSNPIALSRTYKELLKYQSLDPHVHEYLVNKENENKSLKKEVESLNKLLRERESEHERIRTLLQKRVSVAEDASRTSSHLATTLEGELQSIKRLYNDTADELAKLIHLTAPAAAGGLLNGPDGNSNTLIRRASFNHNMNKT